MTLIFKKQNIYSQNSYLHHGKKYTHITTNNKISPSLNSLFRNFLQAYFLIKDVLHYKR